MTPWHSVFLYRRIYIFLFTTYIHYTLLDYTDTAWHTRLQTYQCLYSLLVLYTIQGDTALQGNHDTDTTVGMCNNSPLFYTRHEVCHFCRLRPYRTVSSSRIRPYTVPYRRIRPNNRIVYGRIVYGRIVYGRILYGRIRYGTAVS